MLRQPPRSKVKGRCGCMLDFLKKYSANDSLENNYYENQSY
jgi:hypothetical protein